MSAQTLPAEYPDPVVMLAVRRIRFGPARRENGVDVDHVNSLAASGGDWPPILVSFSDHTVIDGVHRLHAARALGVIEIAAVYFYGSPDEAYLAFVQRNARNGLPLTLREREHAARRVLAMDGVWSDRRIGQLCGISPRTVASLRAKTATHRDGATSASPDATQPQQFRIGKDGRRRPVNPRETRERIAAALEKNPRSSLRAIASAVGASPETVRSVRARLFAPATAKDAAARCGESASAPTRLRGRPATDELLSDAAFCSSPDGNRFISWFSATNIGDDWRNHVGSIPLSRVYEIADQARMRAARWDDFANAVEARAGDRHGRRP
jgi:ParB-like chromosome segregation protein Spo0J